MEKPKYENSLKIMVWLLRRRMSGGRQWQEKVNYFTRFTEQKMRNVYSRERVMEGEETEDGKLIMSERKRKE